ncbi:MAG TPA: hypothetical protein VFG30_12895 [Polyangiales bacterium]|nr:hypothetical protein [Polyangiales bacterium]
MTLSRSRDQGVRSFAWIIAAAAPLGCEPRCGVSSAFSIGKLTAA